MRRLTLNLLRRHLEQGWRGGLELCSKAGRGRAPQASIERPSTGTRDRRGHRSPREGTEMDHQPEPTTVVSAARDVAAASAQAAPEAERTRRLDPDVVKAVLAAGFARHFVPAE